MVVRPIKNHCIYVFIIIISTIIIIIIFFLHQNSRFLVIIVLKNFGSNAPLLENFSPPPPSLLLLTIWYNCWLVDHIQCMVWDFKYIWSVYLIQYIPLQHHRYNCRGHDIHPCHHASVKTLTSNPEVLV